MTTELHAIVADTLFDGEELRTDFAVLIERGRIYSLVPKAELPASVPALSLPRGTWLAPGFVDVQVNGGGDVLFNDDPTPTSIARIAEAHLRFGTTALLPTFISDSREKMIAAIDAAEDAVKHYPNVLGVHLEGPFLSPLKRGVHDRRWLRTPDDCDLQILTRRRQGVMMVTLAPEVVPPGFIAQLVSAGVTVSLGHSNATYAEAKRALAEGATAFTHLFNAMRPIAARDPGLIIAALESPDAWFGIIADGVHVDPALLRVMLKAALGCPFLVSDAMPPVGGREPHFKLRDEEIQVRNGRCMTADGTLAGADLELASAVRNSVRLVGLPLTRALCFASTHPANLVGRGDTLGRIRKGYRADLVAFNPQDLRISRVWTDGQPSCRRSVDDIGPRD